MSNSLQLNSNKTDLFFFDTKSTLSKPKSLVLCSGNCPVTPQSSLFFQSHINNISRTSFFHLCNINRLRPSTHCFHFGRQPCHRQPHQLLQFPSLWSAQQFHPQTPAGPEFCFRIITEPPPHPHITQTLQQIHWPPVQSRAVDKIFLYASRPSIPSHQSSHRPFTSAPWGVELSAVLLLNSGTFFHRI